MNVRNSLIKKGITLSVGILVTSLLFFIVISLTYNTFYQQSVLKDRGETATAWTYSIDNRLDAIYEHLYDLATILYQKTEVRSGSPEMSFTIITDIMNSLDAKIMASSDITAIYIADTDSNVFLYTYSGVIPTNLQSGLKSFVREYCVDNYSSINNRMWNVVDILDHGYFYKALKMGKYVIGAISDVSLYRFTAVDDFNGYIYNGQKFFVCFGDKALLDLVDVNKEDYFSGDYAALTTRLEHVDASTIYMTKPTNIEVPWRMATIFMIVDSALCLFMVGTLIYLLNKGIREPVKSLLEANDRLSVGDFAYRLDTDKAGSDEFRTLYGSFNEMSSKIENLTIESYDAEVKRQRNQLQMLRAQIKPHTFLNAINTINNLTYMDRPQEIRKYISAFASFTRYMLYKAKDWTTIKDELNHIDNYINMQKIRFPDSIEVEYDCSAEVKEERIPYLILFSLVENSFKHAMTLESTMKLYLKAEYYEEAGFKGVKIIEEDNGKGFDVETLQRLINKEKDDLYTKEHLGLNNVRYTLNLICKRDDLLRLSNKIDGQGAHIELLIPQQEDDDETVGM